MEAPVASLKIVHLTAGGRRIPITVEVGLPRRNSDAGEWCCPIQLAGIDDRVRPSYGEDSLQALCIALRHIRSQLETVIELGGRLIYAEDGEEFPLEAYFGRLEGEKS
jgi:hypothetical protein